MSLEKLKELWLELSKVPVNDDDQLSESFLHFEQGTYKFEVWKWFEDQNKEFHVRDFV